MKKKKKNKTKIYCNEYARVCRVSIMQEIFKIFVNAKLNK